MENSTNFSINNSLSFENLDKSQYIKSFLVYMTMEGMIGYYKNILEKINKIKFGL
jgi:hypothetical protein